MSGAPIVNWRSWRQEVLADARAFSIPIRLPSNEVVGELKPLTHVVAQDAAVVSAFTCWRAAYARFFLTQFVPTPERTRAWLQTVLADDRRMLFLIYADGSLVGHYGFRDLSDQTAELDNLLRGERGGHPLLMPAAVRSLTNWLFDSLPLPAVHGHILADNALALKLHIDLGFRLAERLPLVLEKRGEELSWRPGAPGHSSPEGKYYQRVCLTREDCAAAVQGTAGSGRP